MIRHGFVSNSSSTSYIIIDASIGHNIPQFKDDLIVDASFGTTEFNWGPETIKDVGSRIIFSYFQSSENSGWRKMLEEVIKENTNVKNIVWKITNEYSEVDNLAWNKLDYGYVDHQSSASEGQNIEIFESKEILKDFLFGKKSKIVLDNDNH